MERPIISSTEMVPRVLDGSKTQTRRVDKLANRIAQAYDRTWVHFNEHDGWWELKGRSRITDLIETFVLKCPYGQAGDRLWVREAFAINDRGQVLMKADKRLLDEVLDLPDIPIKWKPSIHMPRWASRIDLENVIDPFPQRLHEISEEDAISEGITGYAYRAKHGDEVYWLEHDQGSHRGAFGALWDFLNAKRGYGWDTNPWVWVISFKRLT